MTSGIDSSQLGTLTADLREAPAFVQAAAEGLLKKGAGNIKSDLRSDMAASTHFAPLADTIDYDIVNDATGIEAQVGPHHGSGEPGNLANIAYWGSSLRPGRGHVRDPKEALEAEAPKMEDALARLAGGILQ